MMERERRKKPKRKIELQTNDSLANCMAIKEKKPKQMNIEQNRKNRARSFFF